MRLRRLRLVLATVVLLAIALPVAARANTWIAWVSAALLLVVGLLAAVFHRVDKLADPEVLDAVLSGEAARLDWALAPDAAAVLLDLVLAEKPQVVVELGSGVSTLLLTRSVPRVVSLEHAPAHAAATRRLLEARGLPSGGVVDAPLDGEGFYDTRQVPEQIDMLFVDGPPRRGRHLAASRLGARVTGVVVIDDATRDAVDLDAWRAGGWTVELLPTERGLAILRR